MSKYFVIGIVGMIGMFAGAITSISIVPIILVKIYANDFDVNGIVENISFISVPITVICSVIMIVGFYKDRCN